MMYSPGNIIYFTPFYFSNGDSKNKYFLVLAADKGNIIIASLPTSKDHIPYSTEKKHGCINDDAARLNCYFFKAGTIISECGKFGFERDTYIYGEQITFADKQLMQSVYKKEGRDYQVMCKLSSAEYQSIKNCLKASGVVRNKFKRWL